MIIRYALGPPDDGSITHHHTVVLTSNMQPEELAFYDELAETHAADDDLIVKWRQIDDGEILEISPRVVER